MPARRARFSALDGVRGASALSIVIYHVGLASGYNVHGVLGQLTARLNLGLALFFVLSGFLLYRPFVLTRAQGLARPATVGFWKRRALRIGPAYWAALLLMIALPGLTTLNPGLAAVSSSEFAIFFGFAQVYHASTAAQGLAQAWTLCVEAAFYLLLPAFALLARRISDLTTEAMLIAGLGALSILVRVHGRVHYPIPITLAGTFAWLGAGMLLAIWSVNLRSSGRRNPRVLPCWLAAAALYLLLSVGGLPRSASAGYTAGQEVAEHLGYLAVAVLIILPLCVGEPRGRLARIAGSRPARWLGAISYGVYLWHIVPLTFAVREWYPAGRGQHFLGLMAVTVPAALVLGTASYILIERPFLRLKR